MPVILVSHLSEAEARAYRIADNQLNLNTGHDEDLLRVELQDLDKLELDFDLEILGFGTGELDIIIGGEVPAENDEADNLPAIEELFVTKPRDLWILGNHLLLCGNSLEPANYKALMNGYLALGSVRALKHELERDAIKSPVRISLKGRTMGGVNFSRGALYAILKNPAYIGKISHKDKIHEGLHEGIIPLDIWEQAQTQLKDQTVARTAQTKERHMLQGLLYDTDDIIYSPSFTKRHGRQYRYYISQNLLQNRRHPHGVMARLPAHEIETLVENSVRSKAEKLCSGADGTVLEHVLKHQEDIPAYDLIQKCVAKITINLDQLTINLRPSKFPKLLKKHLNVSVAGHDEEFEITVPYKTGRAKRGAITIEPKNQSDVLDLPSANLKKLVQGTIWRSEHFDGKTLTDIARREGCSDAHIGKCIMSSFDILPTA